jgi:hypothetical protein
VSCFALSAGPMVRFASGKPDRCRFAFGVHARTAKITEVETVRSVAFCLSLLPKAEEEEANRYYPYQEGHPKRPPASGAG